MRTICIINLKGGVAKTATTVNMAAILARCHNKSVLVIDGDSQANTTEFFSKSDERSCTLADVLRSKPDGGKLAKQCIVRSNFKGVDLLPADDSLMDLDLSQVSADRVYTSCLRDLKSAISYDFVVIDCPPAFNAASAAALIAADEVIIPIKLDAFSLRGMTNLMKQIANMRKLNPSLKLSGILPTMWYRSEKISEAMNVLSSSGLPVFPPIRRSNKVDDMTFSQKPIIVSSPHCAAAIDYKRFVAKAVKEAK